MGLTKPKVPFHVSTIKKPQHEYNIFVDNTNLPFNHVWLKWSHGEKRFIHPLVSFFPFNPMGTQKLSSWFLFCFGF